MCVSYYCLSTWATAGRGSHRQCGDISTPTGLIHSCINCLSCVVQRISSRSRLYLLQEKPLRQDRYISVRGITRQNIKKQQDINKGDQHNQRKRLHCLQLNVTMTDDSVMKSRASQQIPNGAKAARRDYNSLTELLHHSLLKRVHPRLLMKSSPKIYQSPRLKISNIIMNR